MADTALAKLIDGENDNVQLETVLKVLQQGLLTKRPPCMFARLGGPTGERLTRAAFAVLVKFSLSMDSFLKLSEKLVKAES